MIWSDLGKEDEGGEEAEGEGEGAGEHAGDHHEGQVRDPQVVHVPPVHQHQSPRAPNQPKHDTHLQHRPDLKVLEELIVQEDPCEEAQERKEVQETEGELRKVQHVQCEVVLHVPEARNQHPYHQEVEESLVDGFVLGVLPDESAGDGDPLEGAGILGVVLSHQLVVALRGFLVNLIVQMERYHGEQGADDLADHEAVVGVQVLSQVGCQEAA
mmetsp:Transcript_44428/g.43102  ORF Transcript_44428/g.43102 Transcript_44428/m.43102 type:complete len:213 (-) Transcript_44428:338-976(-)